jgi:hypothetical protein
MQMSTFTPTTNAKMDIHFRVFVPKINPDPPKREPLKVAKTKKKKAKSRRTNRSRKKRKLRKPKRWARSK